MPSDRARSPLSFKTYALSGEKPGFCDTEIIQDLRSLFEKTLYLVGSIHELTLQDIVGSIHELTLHLDTLCKSYHLYP